MASVGVGVPDSVGVEMLDSTPCASLQTVCTVLGYTNRTASIHSKFKKDSLEGPNAADGKVQCQWRFIGRGEEEEV
jgi:hypothetical protein